MSLYFIFFLSFITSVFSQDFHRKIDLHDQTKILYNEEYINVQNFTNAIYVEDKPCMVYFERIEISYTEFEVEIINKEYLPIKNNDLLCEIPKSLDFEYNLSQKEKKNFLALQIFPYIKKAGRLHFLKSFTVKINPKNRSKLQKNRINKTNSVLSSGDWYKIAVQENGIYKIDKDFLESIGGVPDMLK